MRAATLRRYGSPEVFKIEEMERPVPKADEILVAVHSTSVTSGDVRMRKFNGPAIFWLPMRLIFGILRPRNPIPELAARGRRGDRGRRKPRGHSLFHAPLSPA